MRKVRIGGAAYVVDIEWQTPSAERNLEAAGLRDAATAAGSPDMIVFHGTQYGFAKSSPEEPPSPRPFEGVPSLAAHLRIPSHSFLGSFLLEDESGEKVWWVFAKSEGHIVGGFSDACYVDAESASEAVETLVMLGETSFGEMRRFGTLGESVEFLANHLAPKGPLWRLRSEGRTWSTDRYARRRSEIAKKLGICILALACLYMAGGNAIDHLNSLSFSSAAREKADRLQKQRLAYESDPTRFFREAWKDALPAATTLDACTGMIMGLRAFRAGWELEGATCRVERGAAVLRSTYGHTSFARFPALPGEGLRLDPKNPNEAFGETGVDLHKALRPFAELGHGDLPGHESVRLVLLQIAQTLGAKVTLKQGSPETRTVPEVGIFTAPWTQVVWRLEDVGPAALTGGLGGILDGIPTLAVDEVSYKRANGLFAMSGRCFARTGSGPKAKGRGRGGR
jgi:hypothetical protein